MPQLQKLSTPFLRNHQEKTRIHMGPAERDPILRAALERVSAEESIPPFPTVCASLLPLLNDPDTTVKKFEDIVKMDASLCMAVLRASHSAIFGGGEMETIGDAIRRIGIKRFKKIVMTHAINSAVKDLNVRTNWDLFWFHSILVARLTEKLHSACADNTGMEYIAGLVHDVGKLFIQKFFPDSYSHVITEVAARQLTFEQIESDVLGFCHQDVSALICNKWQLGDRLVSAVLYHHDPTSPDLSETDSLLATCICLADDLANYCGANLEMLRNFHFEDVQEGYAWRFMQTFPRVRSVYIDVEVEVAEIEEALSEMRTA